MKKFILNSFLFLVVSSSFSQKDDLNSHEVSIDFGSFRNRYAFPMTNINYASPLFSKFNLKASARLRSYGTLYFYSNSAYDFSPQLNYYSVKEPTNFYFSAGIGCDVRLRFVNDERSLAVSSAEPIVQVGIHSQLSRFNFHLPIWSRFYSNGLSFTALPEVNFQVSKGIGIYLRDEVSLLSIYQKGGHEWRHDIFLGAHFLF